jgi:hypothetical protein
MNSAPSRPGLGSSGGNLILDVGDGALRVEILKIAAFGTRSRVDDAADERGFSRGQNPLSSVRNWRSTNRRARRTICHSCAIHDSCGEPLSICSFALDDSNLHVLCRSYRG